MIAELASWKKENVGDVDDNHHCGILLPENLISNRDSGLAHYEYYFTI